MAAERGDLNDFPAHAHVHDAKAAADNARAAEQGVDFLGRGVGRHIKVLGVATEQQVAHSAADEIGLMVCIAQPRHDLQGAVADVLAGYAVLVPGNDLQARVAFCDG